MKPIKFKEQNKVYVAEGCGDLPAYKDDREIISCWKGTFSERIKFLFTGIMWFSVQGKSQPPIWLDTAKPFEEAQNED